MSDDYQKPPGLTVGQLRKALEGVPDELEIRVRTNDDFGCAGGIRGVGREHAHDEDDTEFLAIDCSDDPNDFDEEEE